MIRRGDIVLVDFGERHGAEPAGFRPAVVVQNDQGNEYAPNLIVVPMSSRGVDKLYPVEVRVDPPEGGLERASKADCGLIMTVDRDRIKRRLGRLSDGSLASLDRALAVSLGLPLPRSR